MNFFSLKWYAKLNFRSSAYIRLRLACVFLLHIFLLKLIINFPKGQQIVYIFNVWNYHLCCTTIILLCFIIKFWWTNGRNVNKRRETRKEVDIDCSPLHLRRGWTMSKGRWEKKMNAIRCRPSILRRAGSVSSTPPLHFRCSLELKRHRTIYT